MLFSIKIISTDTLGEVLENHKKKQIRIAETEKYPHVTFFFSGGREKTFQWRNQNFKEFSKSSDLRS